MSRLETVMVYIGNSSLWWPCWMLKTRKAGDTEELVAPLIIAVSDFMDNLMLGE